MISYVFGEESIMLIHPAQTVDDIKHYGYCDYSLLKPIFNDYIYYNCYNYSNVPVVPKKFFGNYSLANHQSGLGLS
jgi:hypothetical protein